MKRVLLTAILLSAATASPAIAGSTLTTLVSFSGPNGEYPQAGLMIDAAGNLYGTTTYGGDLTLNNGLGFGTVFELPGTNHQALATLATFNGTNGQFPWSGSLIADASGNLYGTTAGNPDGVPGGGNPPGNGTVFEVAAGTLALTTLANFGVGAGSPVNPDGGVIADAAGNLYGTSYGGGMHGDGAVFKVAAGMHALTTLASFNDSTNGRYPWAGLIADSAGNFYGTTSRGGANGLDAGTVFKLTPNGTLTDLVLFDYTSGNGNYPYYGPLIADSAGNLYGTTYQGGANGDGTVFEVAVGTNTLSTLVSIDASTNSRPIAGLIADAAGNLYGTSGNSVFEVAAGTHAFTTIATPNAGPLYGGLVADAAGNLYGTTYEGGANGRGTVFELSGTGFVVAVPEPASASLLALSGVSLLSRLRSRRM